MTTNTLKKLGLATLIFAGMNFVTVGTAAAQLRSTYTPPVHI